MIFINKHVIAITPNFIKNSDIFSLNSAYTAMVEKYGGTAFILPYTESENIPKILEICDGILFTGGGDISPRLLNEEMHSTVNGINEKRDAFEFALCQKAFEAGKPMLGICRGMQVINAALGGSVYSDISLFNKNAINHNNELMKNCAVHAIKIDKNSCFYDIVKADVIYVNSLHHQCIKEGGLLKVCAAGDDHVPEAAEYNGKTFVLGVQYHPEHLKYGNIYTERILKYFLYK